MVKYISLSELYKTDFEIKHIFALKQTWSAGVVFRMDHPRPQNGIIYLKNCEGIYTDARGKSFTAGKDSIVWLTEQSEYTCHNTKAGNTDSDAYLIQFNLESQGERILISDHPFLVNSADSYAVLSKMREILELVNSALPSPPAIKGSAYSLISLLCKEYSLTLQQRYNCISAGIEYLEKNPTSHTSVEEIAKMCYISSGTFRRLFKEYSGKSPVAFRLEKQIELAKHMLIGEYMPLNRICAKLEIDNVPYFCRLFFKKTGMTPSEYRQKHLQNM